MTVPSDYINSRRRPKGTVETEAFTSTLKGGALCLSDPVANGRHDPPICVDHDRMLSPRHIEERPVAPLPTPGERLPVAVQWLLRIVFIAGPITFAVVGVGRGWPFGITAATTTIAAGIGAAGVLTLPPGWRG